MKKISVILTALLILGLLAGCNTNKNEPNLDIPGYDIQFRTEGSWKAAEEETDFDLQMSDGKASMMVIGFSAEDFVDMPTAEELFLDCNEDLLEEKTEVTVKEELSSKKVDGKTIYTMLYSAKDDSGEKQYLCFMVEFNNEAQSMAWVAYAAKADYIKSNRNSFRTMVEGMVSNDLPAEEEELIFDEEGNLVTEPRPSEDVPYEEDTIPVEENPPAPTEETAAPTETTTAPTEAAAETTAATEATTAPTE